MFCSHCGSQVPDGAAFCAACGTPANGQGAAVQTAVAPAAPVAPAAGSTVFKDFLGMVKGFFSKDVMKTVGVEAKSTGKEWIVALALSVLMFALATTVNVIEMVGSTGFKMMGYMGAGFFKIFGIGLLVGLITAGATFGAVYLLMAAFMKKKVSPMAILNLIGVATLPLTVCQVLNMLLGVIWFPLVVVASIVAVLMSVLMLYVGVQKMEKLDKSPFYPFVLVLALVIIVAGLFGYLLYKGVATTALAGLMMGGVGDLMGGLMGGMGDLGGLMGGLGDLGSSLGGLGDLGSMF